MIKTTYIDRWTVLQHGIGVGTYASRRDAEAHIAIYGGELSFSRRPLSILR